MIDIETPAMGEKIEIPHDGLPSLTVYFQRRCNRSGEIENKIWGVLIYSEKWRYPGEKEWRR